MADDTAMCHVHLFARCDVGGRGFQRLGRRTDDFTCAGGYLVPPLRARHDLWHTLPRLLAVDGCAFGLHTMKGVA